MDAGIAAVLGALAGSVATIGAALATGWSQREGARISARAEHRRQQREEITRIYREFLYSANGFAEALSIIPDKNNLRLQEVLNIRHLPTIHVETMNQLASHVARMNSIHLEMSLLGASGPISQSRKVTESADFLGLSIDFLRSGIQDAEDDVDAIMPATKDTTVWTFLEMISVERDLFRDLIPKYAEVARLAIYDDGTKSRST